MPIQETEESDIVNQSHITYKSEDKLETGSESSDSGIDFPKLDAVAQNPYSRIERIFQILDVIQYCDNVDKLPYILALLSSSIKRTPNINFDGLIYKEVFSFLKEHGIDFNSQNEHGLTPLHLAILNDDINVVKHLLTIKNINPFIQDINGRTPFDYAKEKLKILKMLIEAEYKYGSGKIKFFHLAVQLNQIEIVRYLIKEQKYLIDLKDLYHSLHIAAMEGYADMVKYLIVKGADVNYVSPLEYTALILATIYIGNNEENRLKTIKLLVKNGANVNFISQDEGVLFQKSALHFAVERFIKNNNEDSLDIVSYLLSLPKLNVNICDDRNETALHYVVKSKLDISSQLRILGTLLTRKDIDLLVADNKGKTPLDYAQKPILDVLCKYKKIKNSYETAKSSNSFSYCLATLMAATSFMFVTGSSILLNDTIANYARYIYVGLIILAAVAMLSSVSNLICCHIEKEKIEENFKHKVEDLIKSNNTVIVSNALTQPQVKNITHKVELN